MKTPDWVLYFAHKTKAVGHDSPWEKGWNHGSIVQKNGYIICDSTSLTSIDVDFIIASHNIAPRLLDYIYELESMVDKNWEYEGALMENFNDLRERHINLQGHYRHLDALLKAHMETLQPIKGGEKKGEEE